MIIQIQMNKCNKVQNKMNNYSRNVHLCVHFWAVQGIQKEKKVPHSQQTDSMSVCPPIRALLNHYLKSRRRTLVTLESSGTVLRNLALCDISFLFLETLPAGNFRGLSTDPGPDPGNSLHVTWFAPGMFPGKTVRNTEPERRRRRIFERRSCGSFAQRR